MTEIILGEEMEQPVKCKLVIRNKDDFHLL